MGILWQHDSDDTNYSVRSSGASIRLYTNRVFHSQWNPARPFAGGIWDCLSLPVLYQHTDKPKRILLLGVGGGAVILQLQELIDIEHLCAVEIDKQHLEIAERWFGVRCNRVSMIHADAVSWLKACDERPFDLIIDDLFGHSAGEPERACELNNPWLQTLYSHLAPGGLLIANCVNARELQSAVLSCYKTGFRFGYRWSLPAYENAIAVLSHDALLSRVWSGNLQQSSLNAAMQRQARSIRRRPIRGLKPNGLST